MTHDVDLVLVGARLVTFLAAFGLFGHAAFQIYSPAEFRAPPGLLYRAILPGLVVAGAIGWTFGIARQIGGGMDASTLPLMARVWLTTGFGRALAAASGLGFARALNGLAGGRRPGLDLGLGALLLIALAFVGHATERGAMIAVWAVHLLAAGAWLGGLPPLAFALRREGPSTATLLERFGVLGGGAVGLNVVTGLLAIWSMIGVAGGRLGALYTRVLILKLTLVLALLALAALNRFRLTAMVTRRPREALGALRRTVFLEQLLGFAIIASVATLGQLDPAM